MNGRIAICITGLSTIFNNLTSIIHKYNDEELSNSVFFDLIQNCKSNTDIVFRNMKEASEVVNKLKQFTKDQITELPRSFKVKPLIDEIIDIIKFDWVSKDLKLNFNIDCNQDIEINSYPGAFSQVFSNLILNSVRHGMTKRYSGNISISIEVIDISKVSKMRIIYEDDGVGIDPKISDKIFTPFFTTNNKIGYGLGLSIVKDIITKQLKGTIENISKESDGVRFIILF
ncbi:MAG: HAMP domain-containing histidine kinase [Bacteroidales bacterium]|nr:HAMP domain-containing histidine kinase [Bacteroidales bacterium]